MKNIFVTAIGTDCGKTLVSAILCEALGADYWKPVQSGLPRDSDTVKSLVTNPDISIHPEQYLLKTPASPHAAAKIDNVLIDLKKFVAPKPSGLVIEGAGGCLVPLNDNDFVIDIASRLHCDVVLVSNLYLGSINHTLLTAEALQKRQLNVAGIIFNGPTNPESERIILHHTGYKLLLKIEQESKIDKPIVIKYASQLKKKMHE